MQVTANCGKLIVQGGWAMCPLCGKGKLQRVLPTTSAQNLPRYCKRCRREIVIDIAPEPLRLSLD